MKKKICQALFEEYIYLIILALFLLYYSADTIMYPVDWYKYKLDYNYIHTFLFVYVFFKYVFIERPVFRNKEGILAFLLLFSFIISYQHTGYAELFDTVLLILGAKNVRSMIILKTYLMIKIPFIISTVICSQRGLIENLIYNQHGRIRKAFGFIYPTDFAAQVFFVIVAWSLVRQAKTTFYELIGMVLVAVFLKYNCDTRCSTISILLVVGSVAFWKIAKRVSLDCVIRSLIIQVVSSICIVASYLFSATMIFLCRFYNSDNSFLKVLNDITSQRLKLGKKTFDNYNVKLFGQYIEMQGNGGTTEKPINYTFIDSSYINILMRYGLLVFITVLMLITFLMWRNYQNMFVLVLIVLVCLHSMIEQHLFEIHYNFVLLLPFSVPDAGTDIIRKWWGSRFCLTKK